MAPALSKDRVQRPKVSSHFKLAEVNMEALNDPLPPHHPSSPRTQMTPALALEALISQEGQISSFYQDHSAPTSSVHPSMKMTQMTDITYPHVTNETRRLLSEVANIRKQYEHRSINELAADPPPIVTQQKVAKKVKKLKKVASNSVAMTTAEEESNNLPSTAINSQKPPKKKRIVTHVDSIDFGLTSLNSSPSKLSKKQSSMRVSGEVSGNVGHTQEQAAKDTADESNQAKVSNVIQDLQPTALKSDNSAAPPTPSAVEAAETALKTPVKDAKPWRKNMKVKSENDPLPPEEDKEDLVVQTDPKPWRKNMKPSASVESKKSEQATEVSCHVRNARPPRDHEKVKKFIKDKRRKASEERQAQEEDSRRKKTQVQERLLALDAFRKTQDVMAKSKQQSTSEVVLRLRKQEEEDQLKLMLQKLTDEMKAQHYPSERVQEQSTSLTKGVKENTLVTSADSLVTEAEVASNKSSSKNNISSRLIAANEKSVSPIQSVSQVKLKTRPTPTEANQTFKSKLEQVRMKHSQVMNTIKTREPDLIVRPVAEIFQPKKSLPKPDEFNVMSSAMRQSWKEDERPSSKEDKSIGDGGDLTVSEGPLLSDSETVVSAALKSVGQCKTLSSSKDDIDDVPVRDRSTPIGHQDQPQEQVPLALQLRFQAELNQMESIQEAERQLHQISQIRDVVTARNETAVYAQALVSKNHANIDAQNKSNKKPDQRSGSRRSSSSRETRSQFEERMRRELQDLFSSRMAELMKHQMEATKMTVEAANRLTKMESKRKQRPGHHRSSKASPSIREEDIKSIISRTESSIPEILNVVEATDRSAKDIQRSIKTAIEELSLANDDDSSKTSNITEEIMAELTDNNENFKGSNGNDDDDDATSSGSSTWLTGNFFWQHMEDQRVRDKQQYTMIKRREKMLTAKTKEALKDIAQQRKGTNLDESKFTELSSQEKKIRKKYRQQKNELANLLQSLRVAEKERQLLLRQHKKMSSSSHPGSKELWNVSTSKSLSDVSSASSASPHFVISEEEFVEKNLRQKQVKTVIKTPLSPKRTTPMRQHRQRHSSAESEADSISFVSSHHSQQVENVSSSAGGDQSDLELRVNTLKDELREREKTAAKLKREQKLARQERLKAQEEALKKQIEVYDHIIQKTKTDIEANFATAAASSPSSSSPSPRVTQPQIKVPKQHSRPESQLSCETTTSITTPQPSISIEEESGGTSTDTIIASPQKPATPAFNIDEVPEALGHNANYSDDFTSSVSSSVPQSKPKPPSEKSVDALCGQLLEAMIEDTVGRLKSKSKLSSNAITDSTANATGEPVTPTSISSRPKSKSPPVVNHMQTTFDVSSESSSDEDLAKETTEDDTTLATPDELPEEQSVHPNNQDGDFIDDDFGLSLKKEWEHLRQQQMLIEEEISNIQKDSSSKPPPPYSPPPAAASAVSPEIAGQRSPRKVQLKPESPRYVPSASDQLPDLVNALVGGLLANKDRLDEISVDTIDLKSVMKASEHADSQSIFVGFLFDMVKDIIKEVLRKETEEQNPAWMSQKNLTLGRHHIPGSLDEWQKLVRRQVLVAFNHEPRAAKENLIIRWSHKRRDRVDQVLVRELHGEESAWINYEEDEIQVKDELSNTLLDSLIADTVQAFKKVPAFSC